ncbi:MAG: uracil-DNA glycosylase, partial [Planctomycetaceae bacterium]|nr:uracil-DNA glycosylase [Planctomycetaceae bacterium]
MTLDFETTDAALQGLIARLEMDQDLGVDLIQNGPAALDAVIRLAARADEAPPTQPHPSPVHRSAVPAAPASNRSVDESGPEKPAARQHRPSAQPPSAPPATVRPPSGRFRTTLVPVPEVAASPAKEAALAALRAECMACGLCELCERRSSVVWGEGSLDADVIFIGEGPGRDEDREGRPFVGRSGRLLTDIIEKGMKTPRGRVFITNVVKCRPPGNRDPRSVEVDACSRYLRAQIDVIKPKVIVAVGGVAGCALLGLPPRSPGLRGKWHQYAGIPMRVIFHPSYLLRQRQHDADRTDADRQTWKDVQEVMTQVQG